MDTSLFSFSVFPGTPAAPGMPCQGEDSKYILKLYNIWPFFVTFGVRSIKTVRGIWN